MYVGKTTLGKRLSNILNLPLKDSDSIVEEICGCSIEEIFSQKGEVFFREREREVLISLLKQDNIIISTGGGLPCYKDNMLLIKQYCKSIYLKMNAEQILSRTESSKKRRPLLEKVLPEERLNYIEKSLKERDFFYKQADLHIEAFSVNNLDLQILIDYL